MSEIILFHRQVTNLQMFAALCIVAYVVLGLTFACLNALKIKVQNSKSHNELEKQLRILNNTMKRKNF